MMQRRSWSWYSFSAIALGVLVVVACLPVIYGILHAFGGEGESGAVLDSRQRGLLWNSVLIAVCTSVVSTLLGVSVGLALEYVRVPLRGLLAWCVAVSFLIPSYVAAIAWIELAGKSGIIAKWLSVFGDGVAAPSIYGLPGTIWVLSLSYYPLVAAATVVALMGFDHRLDESARLVARPFRRLVGVVLPLLSPTIFAGALLVFLLALVGYAVPSLLQVNVYPVEIHNRFSAFHDIRGGFAQAFLLLLIGGLAVCLWYWRVRPSRRWAMTVSGPAAPRVTGRTRTWAAIWCWLVVGVSTGLPISVLVWRALPLSSFVEVWKTAWQEFVASVAIAACAATLITVLGACVVYASRRGRLKGAVYAAAVVPFLVSGPALGIGLIVLWNHEGPRSLVYDSVAVAVLACAARFLFVGIAGTDAALGRLKPELAEAAALSGASWQRRALGVELPLCLPWLAGVWGLSFLLAFGEVDATLLVMPPGVTTLPVRIFGLMHYGPSQLVAALSVTIAGVMAAGAVLTAAACLYVRRRLYGRRTSR